MIVKGLSGLGWERTGASFYFGIGFGIIQGVGQQGLKLAALKFVLGISIVHCSPASYYYEKVIAQVPFFRGLYVTLRCPPGPVKSGQFLCNPYLAGHAGSPLRAGPETASPGP